MALYNKCASEDYHSRIRFYYRRVHVETIPVNGLGYPYQSTFREMYITSEITTNNPMLPISRA